MVCSGGRCGSEEEAHRAAEPVGKLAQLCERRSGVSHFPRTDAARVDGGGDHAGGLVTAEPSVLARPAQHRRRHRRQWRSRHDDIMAQPPDRPASSRTTGASRPRSATARPPPSRRRRTRWIEVVLLGSDSIKTVKLTHANYDDGSGAVSKVSRGYLTPALPEPSARLTPARSGWLRAQQGDNRATRRPTAPKSCRCPPAVPVRAGLCVPARAARRRRP